MLDYFSYNNGSDIVPDGAFRISPSQLSRFFDDTPNWWREFYLGEAPKFTGSTATELGSCVHAAAHMYTLTQSVDYAQIDSYISSISNPEVDKSVIQECYPVMVSTLLASFLEQQSATIVEAEKFIWLELLPGIGVGGSVDRYSNKLGGCISDFKTMGSLDSARVPSSFPRPYWFQQLTYAYIMRKLGYPVNYMELVYVSRPNVGRISEKTGKPMKDYPSEVNVLREPVTDEGLEIIESVLKLVAESVQFAKSNPDQLYLLAQDYRLKPKPKHKLFIKETI